MSANFIIQLLNEMNVMQKRDVEQLAKYRTLSMELDSVMRERAEAIRLLENACKPESINMSLREAMTGRA